MKIPKAQRKAVLKMLITASMLTCAESKEVTPSFKELTIAIMQTSEFWMTILVLSLATVGLFTILKALWKPILKILRPIKSIEDLDAEEIEVLKIRSKQIQVSQHGWERTHLWHEMWCNSARNSTTSKI